jgi:hypothetical protein
MRTRRFARCIERAATGLEAGTLEEVRDALDEARVLCPDAPEIAELEQRIAALPSPSATLLTLDVPRQEPPAGWLRVMAAMCVLLLLFGLFGFGLTYLYLTGPARTLLSSESAKASPESNSAIAPAELTNTAGTSGASPTPPSVSAVRPDTATTAPASSAPAQPPSPAPAMTAAAAPSETTAASGNASTASNTVRTQPQRDAAGPRGDDAASSIARSERDRRQPPAGSAAKPAEAGGMASRLGVRSNPPAEPPTPRAPATAPAPSPAPPSSTIASASAPPSEAEAVEKRPTLDPVPAIASNMPSTPVPATSSAPIDAPVPAVRTASNSASRAEETAQIRSVLNRYETAYNRLDANAASSVWPNVDQAALDRAFKGLISQRVSLGLCDITVAGDVGGASCAGKARWEPRVGGGLQTADRHWTFNLRKSTDGGWHIEQIRVR